MTWSTRPIWRLCGLESGELRCFARLTALWSAVGSKLFGGRGLQGGRCMPPVLAVLSCLPPPPLLMLLLLLLLLLLMPLLLLMLLPEIRIHSKLAVRREGAVMQS